MFGFNHSKISIKLNELIQANQVKYISKINVIYSILKVNLEICIFFNKTFLVLEDLILGFLFDFKC